MNDLDDGRSTPSAVRPDGQWSSLRRVTLWGVLTFSLGAGFAGGADAAPATVTTAAGTVAEYSDGAAVPVVTYTEIAGVVGAGPSLTIYGDGRAVADYPKGWKRAGRHTLQLDRAAVNALLATLVDAGVVEFDTEAVRSAVRTASQQQRAAGAPQFLEMTDPDVTVIEVHLDRYESAAAPEARGVAKRIAWNNLTQEVRQHPGVSALTKLETARQALRAVMIRDGFTKVE